MKQNVNKLILITWTLLIMTSCDSKQEFDSSKWKQKSVDWWMTDVREKIVDDLITSDTLIGMNKHQVIELLGQPKSENEDELKYLIREKYGTDIDPEYISNLKIEFDNDGQVITCEIEK